MPPSLEVARFALSSLIGKYVKLQYDNGDVRDGHIKSVIVTRLGALLETTDNRQFSVGNSLRQMQVWEGKHHE